MKEIIKRHEEPVSGDEKIENIEEIKQVFHPDSIWNIFERLEGSKSEFCQKTLNQIANASPVSMAVIFE